MATNPSTLPENTGRITAPDLDYTYGSAKDDSTGTTGDGTPIKKALMNDTYGLQQALLRSASTVPTGNADTQSNSQYFQAINGLASGAANTYDDTGVVNAYVLALKAGQQIQLSLFDGMVVHFSPSVASTGPSTVDVSLILGQVAGTTVKDIKTVSGGDLLGGELTGKQEIIFSAISDNFSKTVEALAINGVNPLGRFTKTSGGYCRVVAKGATTPSGSLLFDHVVTLPIAVNFDSQAQSKDHTVTTSFSPDDFSGSGSGQYGYITCETILINTDQFRIRVVQALTNIGSFYSLRLEGTNLF